MTAAVLALVAAMAVAPFAADIDSRVERSATAEFSGEALISCDTPDGSRSDVFNVAQVDGAFLAWHDGQQEAVSVSPGLSMTSADGQIEASIVEASSATGLDSYTISEEATSAYLGRQAEELVLSRDGVERVRLTLDTETGAVLRTITYGADGSAYCDRRLLAFSTDVSGVPSLRLDADVDPSVPVDSAPESLPASVGGFELVDTYPVEEGTLSYYTDGFFSVGVVVTRRPLKIPGEDTAVEVESDQGSYVRAYRPGAVTVTWSRAPEKLAVIGDMPPDMVDKFLEALPAPEKENLFDRIWSRLFG